MALRLDFPCLPQSHIDLTFLKDLPEYETSRPYYVSGSLPEEHESSRTNIQYQTLHQVPLFNLRGQEHKLSVEKHGFQIINVPDEVLCLDVKGTQRQVYIEKMAEVVKCHLDASFVLCYDYRVHSLSGLLGSVTGH